MKTISWTKTCCVNVKKSYLELLVSVGTGPAVLCTPFVLLYCLPRTTVRSTGEKFGPYAMIVTDNKRVVIKRQDLHTAPNIARLHRNTAHRDIFLQVSKPMVAPAAFPQGFSGRCARNIRWTSKHIPWRSISILC